MPKFQNEEDAAYQMERKLKKKEESGAVLLVLDDVWCGSESLLAKFKFRTSKSKVVVTSRNEFPEFGSTYDLELLNDDDAMALFRHSAIPQNGSCNYTPTDRLVKKVVCHSTLIYRTCTYTSSICIHFFSLQTTSDFIC